MYLAWILFQIPEHSSPDITCYYIVLMTTGSVREDSTQVFKKYAHQEFLQWHNKSSQLVVYPVLSQGFRGELSD